MSKKRHNLTAIIKDRKGNILSIGKNSYIKSHPVQAKWAELAGEPEKIFLHAEIHAIIQCDNIGKAYSIELYRYHSDGTPGNAKPCKICVGALAKTNIKIIRYT